MDVFKLTFKTTIVGISAFLWIGIAIDLIAPDFLARAKSVLAEANQTLAAAVLLSCAYCLGSAILPISGQLVNDEHWPVREQAIRCRVEVEEGRQLRAAGKTNLAINLPAVDTSCDRPYWERLLDKKPGANTNATGILVSNDVKV